MEIKFNKFESGFKNLASDEILYLPKLAIFKVIDKRKPNYKIFQIILFKLCVSIWYEVKIKQDFIIE